MTNEHLMKEIGNCIKIGRHNKGMKQRELSLLVGKTRSQIANYETGRFNMTVVTLDKIFSILNIKMEIKLTNDK